MKRLRRLLLIHAVITFAAGVVLIVAPQQIPKAVTIRLPHDAYLIAYLLGAAELALAFLSFQSRALTDAKSLRLICFAFIIFHAASAAVELYAIAQGASIKVWGNVALRILMIILFFYYGVRNLKIA